MRYQDLNNFYPPNGKKRHKPRKLAFTAFPFILTIS